MTFLPIVERELRAASRRRSGYWLRSGYGLMAIIVGFFVFLANIDSPSRNIGRDMFDALGWLSMPYCLLCGIRLTADCLSQEKREGTLGLLFEKPSLRTRVSFHDIRGGTERNGPCRYFGRPSIASTPSPRRTTAGLTTSEG